MKKIYPEKKTRNLNKYEKDEIRRDIAERKDSFEISRKHKCSYSQVCGIKAAVTKGQ